MVLRFLAEREPYLSYLREGDPEGVLFFSPLPTGKDWPCGQDSPGDAEPELVVLPASRYLAQRPEERDSLPHIAYGSAAAMRSAFEAGCADYLRDPWPLEELRARALGLRRRLGKSARLRLMEGIELEGLSIRGTEAAAPLSPSERLLIELLLLNKGMIVPRRAIALALWGEERPSSRSIDVLASSLRRKLERVKTGSAAFLKARRGLGYRLSEQSVDKL
jgi:CheY-like chemotaxis protein